MKKIVILLLSAATVLLTGCVSTPVAPVDRRVTLSPDLTGDVMVTDIRCTKGTGDFLSFQANVVNMTGSDYRVEWRIVWLDADGVEIESITSVWNRRMLAPQEIAGLKGTAPSKDAADMRLYVQRLK